MEKQIERKNEEHVIARMIQLIKELDDLYFKNVGRTPNWTIEDFKKRSNITGKDIPNEVVVRAEKLLDELQTLRESWKEDAPFKNFRVISSRNGFLVRDWDDVKKEASIYFNDRKLPIDDYIAYKNGVVVGKKDGRVVFINKDHEIQTKYIDISRDDNNFVIDPDKHVAAFSGTKENGRQVAVINGKEVEGEYDYVQQLHVLENGDVAYVVGSVNKDDRKKDRERLSINGIVAPQEYARIHMGTIQTKGDSISVSVNREVIGDDYQHVGYKVMRDEDGKVVSLELTPLEKL